MKMEKFTIEYIREQQSKMKDYTIVLLKKTPKIKESGADTIIFEHARKNFALREEGLASIICPVFDHPEFGGLYIFNIDVDQTKKIMEDDPAVKAGVFQYEIYSGKSFPGDSLNFGA